MKKICTLLLACSVVISAQAQSYVKRGENGVLVIHNASTKLKPADPSGSKTTAVAKTKNSKTILSRGTAADATIVGITQYDLQSNASTSRRVIRYADGKVSAAWTYSAQADPYLDRGTGYNHFDGTAWKDAPTKRLEKERCGFSSMTNNASGAEIIITHNAAGGAADNFATYVTKVAIPGVITTAGVTSTKPISNNNGGTYATGNLNALWNKSASAGDNIYVIKTSSTGNTGGGVDPTTTPRLLTPLYFSKSADGGTTWTKFNLLAEEDSANYPKGVTSAERYNIDAFDKYVAIVSSDRYSDLTLWKSDDFGATFKRTVVESFPIKNWGFGFSDANNDGIADTLSSSDGSMSVLVDKQGTAHLFYGRMLFYNPTEDSTTFQIPVSDKSIYYWNDKTKTVKNIANAPDTDNDGQYTVGSNFASDYGDVTLAGIPTSGIDDAGNLYLAYTAVVEGDTTNTDLSTIPGQSFRNLFAIRSTDNGANWTSPVNLTETTYIENTFPSMARRVDSDIHLLWQRDIEPGTNLQNQDPQGENEIVYQSWPVSIFNNVNVSEKTLANVNLLAYPNPNATGVVNFDVNSVKEVNATITVTDIIGQVVKVITPSTVAAGNSTFSADLSNLANGIYFYSLETKEGRTSTQKLILTR